MKNKYILKYKGSNSKELAKNLTFIKQSKEVNIIDGNDKLLLAEMNDKTKTLLEQQLEQWSFYEQKMLSKPPDNKRKLKRRTYK